MEKQALYEAIFTRKSVRKFQMTPLSADERTALLSYAEATRPLDKSIDIQWVLVDHGQINNPFPIKAPHYLCLYANADGPYLMNAGFRMQQVDLYLSALGLGSCWLGMAKPTRQAPPPIVGMEYVIMLAVGKAAGPMRRNFTSEFNRKSLSEITDIASPEAWFEPVRLAPSASNTQTWYFTGDEQALTIWRKKPNLIQAALYNRINQIDSGIALCHLWLSLEQQQKEVSFTFEPDQSRPGLDWMAKVMING